MQPPVNDGVANKVTLEDGTVAYYDAKGNLRKKFGWGALNDLAKGLCRLVTKFSPIIKQVFGENKTILLVLDIANVACSALQDIAEPLSEGADIIDSAGLLQEYLGALQGIIDTYQEGA